VDIFGNKSSDKIYGNRKPSKKTDELEFSFVVENEEIGQRVEEQVSSDKNFRIPKYIAVVLFVILFAKLFMSQIIYGKVADDLAKGNKIRPRVLEATRGVVYDSSGSWLARNVPAFDLAVYPSDLPKNKQQRLDIYQKLSEICGIESGEIKETAEANGLLSFDSVVIKANITREESLLYEEKIAGLPGVEVAKRSSREYGSIPGLSHILGYTGKISQEDIEKFPNRRLSDWLGKSGLELQYEEYLHGTDGVEQIEVDSKGNVERVLVDKDNKEPVAGDSLTLYINKDLQQSVATFLVNGLEEAKKITGDESIRSGVAIVMDPNTGGVLSLVSLPSYDNNLFANGISNQDYQNLINDEANPMFNRATYGKYPPGSIIKPLMATAGLSEGSLQRNTAFDTPSEIRVGDFVFPDWKDHGVTDIETAIAESNNIFFYGIGGGFDKIKGLGINKIKEWWKKFGLGRKSGIDLPGEATGLLPDPEWKEETVGESWYLGNTYHVSIGQGDLLVTPIQMLKMVSAIANGGKLVAPQIVKKISDANGNVVKEFAPRIENESVASADIIETVRRGMRKTVTMGSARNLNDLPVAVAGKTGTAQFFGNQKTHAWFECYAPYEDPQIALIVLVEGGGGGHEIAVPIARNILEYYFLDR
jgi:penicillin-binding protein 2